MNDSRSRDEDSICKEWNGNVDNIIYLGRELKTQNFMNDAWLWLT